MNSEIISDEFLAKSARWRQQNIRPSIIFFTLANDVTVTQRRLNCHYIVKLMLCETRFSSIFLLSMASTERLRLSAVTE